MVIYIIASVAFLWLIVLSFFIFKTRKHYINLTSRTKKEKIDDILDKLIDDDNKLGAEIGKIRKEIEAIMKESSMHFQRVGLVRFNPFGRVGVDQSFVLALLNKEKNGIVINFIYTHEGVRVYAKHIKDGKGREHELSDEEKKAIEESSITN